MKIALKSQNAGWVIDAIVNDYKKYTKHDVVGVNENPDLVWCVNLFSFPSLVKNIPESCISIVHAHHINEDRIREYDFASFNKASLCVVCSRKSEVAANKYLNIPIYKLSYWLLTSNVVVKNDNMIKSLRSVIAPNNELIIGSFIKDGNGKKGSTPKLSKGPDVFIDVLNKINEQRKIKVVLAGYARQYVMDELTRLKIPFLYKEKYHNLPSLYDCLDLYLVTSRFEGGPQSILEASYRKVRILSTDVGIATDVLHSDCICNRVSDFIDKIDVDRRDYNYNNVINNYMPLDVISKWDAFFDKCYIEKMKYRVNNVKGLKYEYWKK